MNNNEQISPVITVAYGDGIGCEIMEATLLVLREAGANIAVETIEIGERIYNMGSKTGVLPSAWESLRRNKLLLKAPTQTPEGDDYKSSTAIISERFALTITTSEGAGMEAHSSSIGEEFALFEAACDCNVALAGKNIANPSGMIMAAIDMLLYIEQKEVAERIKQALKQTRADGLHTADIYQRKTSKQKLGTREFAEEIIARLW